MQQLGSETLMVTRHQKLDQGKTRSVLGQREEEQLAMKLTVCMSEHVIELSVTFFKLKIMQESSAMKYYN